MSDIFSKDTWLSTILECPAYHLIDHKAAGQVSSLGKNIFCDAKCPVDDIVAARALARAGFFVVDVNLYFAGDPFVSKNTTWEARPARPDDESAVADIAGSCFSYSRFHLDPFIGKVKADAIKRAWGRNYFAGKRGDLMIVAEGPQGLVGFQQLIKKDKGLWVIDLVGVQASARGQGAGRAMVGAMSSLCDGITSIGVGTQAANTPSIEFYARQGFYQKRAQYVFHYHGDKV